MGMFKAVNHIGIYTKNRDEAVKFYRDVLGMEFKFELVSESDGIKIAMMELGGQQVELLEVPNEDGSCEVAALNVLNHFALQVDDIDKAFEYIKASGVKMEGREIYKVPHFGSEDTNLRVAFFRGPNGERIELLQYI